MNEPESQNWERSLRRRLAIEAMKQKVERGRASLYETQEEEIIPFFRKPQFIWSAAATVLIILISAGVFWQLKRPPSLYNDFYTKFHALDGQPAGADSSISVRKPLSLFTYEYVQGHYEKAEAALREIDERWAENDTLRFYRAMLQMEKQQYRKALMDLDELCVRTGPSQADACWYAALARIATKDVSGARSYLQSLSQHATYGQRAGALLKKMEKM